MSIRVLPPEIADQIAAGEVVERPASVVKELVENALDAGAKNITIHIEDGGKTLISVLDDGKGMTADDAQKSVLRHATSKITTIDDLFSVQSFGFRGEALAAISSVSHFSLTTKTQDENAGTKISVSAGTMDSPTLCPANTGTHIEVRNLFFPTPVRLKHLKNTSTEFRHIWKEVSGFALAFPDVSFEVYKDKTLYKSLPSSTLQQRLIDIVDGKSQEFFAVEYQNHGMRLTGFVVAPGMCISQKKKQYFFVNGRRIEDAQASFAIREAYLQTAGIERHLHPVFALFLEVDPLLVDVNVHPRKREVKFSEPRDVFSVLKRGVGSTLEQNAQTAYSPSLKNSAYPSNPEKFLGKNESFSNGRINETRAKPSFSGNAFVRPSFSAMNLFSQKNTDRDWKLENNSQEKMDSGENDSFENLRLIGQVARKYIVAESDTGVVFFDQHALHERERFETFWNAFQDQKTSGNFRSQSLLIPEKIRLEIDEVEILFQERNKALLKRYGFDFQILGDEEIEVLAIPQLLEGEKIPEIFQSFAEHFLDGKIGETYMDQCMRKRLEYKSCRGSVMFGDTLEWEEMERLLADFQTTKWRNLCPHGRPNHWYIPFEELDQKFHR